MDEKELTRDDLVALLRRVSKAAGDYLVARREHQQAIVAQQREMMRLRSQGNSPRSIVQAVKPLEKKRNEATGREVLTVKVLAEELQEVPPCLRE